MDSKSKKTSINWLVLCFMAVVLSLSSCGVYSLSGASVDPNVKTVSVAYFPHKADNGPAIAGDLFTNDLKAKMLGFNLNSVNTNGDVQFSGYISKYNYELRAPAAGETTNQRRINMTVQVKYDNKINPEESWEQSFSRFIDFPVSEDLASIEESLISQLNELLVDDVFNKAFGNW